MRGRGPFDSGQGRSAPHLHDYVDARFPVGFYLADLDGWDSSLVQGMGQGFAFGGGDQETSGGLGIVEDGAEVFGNLLVVFDQAFGEVAVVGQASGDVAGVDTLEARMTSLAWPIRPKPVTSVRAETLNTGSFGSA